MRVGLDVGGSKIDAVAVDHRGDVRARVRGATGWGPAAVVAAVVDVVHALADRLPDDAGRGGAMAFESIGIGVPGQIADDGGRVLHAVNLGIEDLALADAVAPVLGVPVRVENDVKAAALGAARLHLAASPSASLAYLNLGTGIAAGHVVDGRLQRGSRGGAGEIGHLSVDPAGPLCRCGQRGCIEALAGGGALAARWGRPGALPVRDLFDAADAGDPEARLLREGFARGVAAAVRVLVLALDVDVVMLGGGLTRLGDRLTAHVDRELERSRRTSRFLASLDLERRVRLLPDGSPAPAVGAALVGASGAIDLDATAGAPGAGRAWDDRRNEMEKEVHPWPR